MHKITISLLAVIGFLTLAFMSPVRGLTPPHDEPQRQRIESIWQEALTGRGRDAAIRKLSEIAADQAQAADLRINAVKKLAAVEAFATTNLMQVIVMSIPLQRNPNDNDEFATEFTQKLVLRDQALLAYYRLCFASEKSPDQKYKVLTMALQGNSFSSSHWAMDQLVFRGEERILDFVQTHRTEFSDEESIDLLRRKFAIMKSPGGPSVGLELTARGEHEQLKGLSAADKRRLQSWASNARNELLQNSTSP